MRLSVVALALVGIYASSSWSIESFVVKDIKVEGIQRTEAGIGILLSLPIKVKSRRPIKAGQRHQGTDTQRASFPMALLEKEGDVLVVIVQSARDRTDRYQWELASRKDSLKDGLARSTAVSQNLR
jgi:outer membrane protein insertion porin family